jgi:hypothetical protein
MNIVPRPNMLQFVYNWNGLPLMGCVNIDVKVKWTLSSWKKNSYSSFHCHAWCTFINLVRGLAMTLNSVTNMWSQFANPINIQPWFTCGGHGMHVTTSTFVEPLTF